MKDYGDHKRILRHHIVSGVQIVAVSGNVFGLFYEFSECPIEELGLLSLYIFLLFCSRIGVETFFILQFEIAYIAVWTDVITARMAVMFRIFVFHCQLSMAQITGCSRSVLQLLLRC